MANLETFACWFVEKKYDANEQTAGINIILKTAEPSIVPVPISSFDMNTPIIDVNSSGADVPIAMNVAPATSAGKFNSVVFYWRKHPQMRFRNILINQITYHH